MKLNDKQITEYLLRCYTAVDGLWFVKLEEKCGFDTALDIDYEVWKAMPKNQARMLKSMVNPGNGIEALFDCLTTMLTLEGYTFNAEKTENPHGFRIIIEKCPWFDLLVKAFDSSLILKPFAREAAASHKDSGIGPRFLR